MTSASVLREGELFRRYSVLRSKSRLRDKVGANNHQNRKGRLMFKIVITVVAAITVTSVSGAIADRNAIATEIGYPPYVRRQCDDGIGINCLKAWQDRIYIGYGSWSPNRGPVCINYFLPSDNKFVTETVYIDDENRNQVFLLEDSISNYVEIVDKLYITGTDPMPYPNETPAESWEWGDFYRNDGSGWVKYRTIPNGVHTFDMSKKDGYFFAAIGVEPGEIPLLRSEDGGESWVDAIASTGIIRFNHLFKLQHALYAIASRGDPGKVYKYDGNTKLFAETSWNLMPGNAKAVACIAVTDDRIYYIAMGNNHIYTALQEQNGVELAKHNPDEKIWDLKIVDKYLYMLTTVESGDEYTVVIYRIEGTIYKSSVSTVLPSEAISMEILNDTIYLGTRSGVIYSITDDS